MKKYRLSVCKGADCKDNGSDPVFAQANAAVKAAGLQGRCEVYRGGCYGLTAEEEALIFSAALRREELGMEARLSLFAALSQRLQEDADLFKPAHLSDEKLVLLCAAALAKRNAERSKASGKKGRLRNMLARP